MRLEDVERTHLALLAGAVFCALATGWLSPWSVLLGGAFMGTNVWIMRRMFRRIMLAGETSRVMGLVLGKFVLFLGFLSVLFWRAPIDAMSFALGSMLLLVASVVETLRQPRPALP